MNMAEDVITFKRKGYELTGQTQDYLLQIYSPKQVALSRMVLDDTYSVSCTVTKLATILLPSVSRMTIPQLRYKQEHGKGNHLQIRVACLQSQGSMSLEQELVIKVGDTPS